MVRIAVLPKASLNAARLDRSPAGEHYPTRAGALSPATTAVAAVEPSQDVPRSDALQAASAIELAQVGRTSLAPPSPPMPPHLPPPMVPDAVAIAAALPPTQLPQLLGDAVGAAAADAPMPAQQTLPLGDAVGAAEAGAAPLTATADAPMPAHTSGFTPGSGLQGCATGYHRKVPPARVEAARMVTRATLE